MFKALIISIALIISGCGAISPYFEAGKDEVEKISTSVTDAAMYQICHLIRSRDQERIFYTVEKKEARSGICSYKISVIEGANEGSEE
jgi:hypothetical protein